MLVAFLVRLVGIAWGLPQGFEEAYPLKKAWAMWGLAGAGVFDPNPHFFKYPSLTIDLQVLAIGLVRAWLALTGQARSALEVRAVYTMDPTPFYVAGRTVTTVLGALTVWPAFAIAKRAGGAGAAVIAGLLVALSVPLIEKAQVIEVDVPVALFVTLAVACALRLAEPASARPMRGALAAGAAAGLAASTKYPGAIALVPVLFAVVLRARADRGFGLRAAVQAALCVVAAFAAAFLITSPFVVLDYVTFLHQIAEEREHMSLGQFGAGGGATWAYYARAWFGSLLGPALGAAAAAGLVYFAAARRERWALLTASCVFPFLIVLSTWAMQADRYLIAILPLAQVAGAVTLVLLAGWALALLRPASRNAHAQARARVPWAIILGLAALLVVLDVPEWSMHARRLGPDSRALAQRWVEQNVAPGSLIALEPYGPSLVSPIALSGVDRELLTELRRRGFAPPLYGVLPIAMFQVGAERSAALYDPALYRSVDLWIVSASVRDRYRTDPALFRPQLAFYDTLAAHWPLLATFAPPTGTGAPIAIYRNPGSDRPFALAPSPPPAIDAKTLTGSGAGGVAYFYYAYGLTEEAFGQPAYALAAYRVAAACPQGEGGPSKSTLDGALRRAASRLPGGGP